MGQIRTLHLSLGDMLLYEDVIAIGGRLLGDVLVRSMAHSTVDAFFLRELVRGFASTSANFFGVAGTAGGLGSGTSTCPAALLFRGVRRVLAASVPTALVGTLGLTDLPLRPSPRNHAVLFISAPYEWSTEESQPT